MKSFSFLSVHYRQFELAKKGLSIFVGREGCGGFKIVVLTTDTSEFTLCSWLM